LRQHAEILQKRTEIPHKTKYNATLQYPYRILLNFTTLDSSYLFTKVMTIFLIQPSLTR